MYKSGPRGKQPAKRGKNPGKKPGLPLIRAAVFRVHYQHLEEFVEAIYGFPLDFRSAAGVGGAVIPEYNVTGDLPTDEWRRHAAGVRAGRPTKNVQVILATLAADGHIPAGSYSVSIQEPPNPVWDYRRLLEITGDPLAPECIEFKNKHRANQRFTRHARSIDRAISS